MEQSKITDALESFQHAQLDFSETAQNVQMVGVLHNNTSSRIIHRMVI